MSLVSLDQLKTSYLNWLNERITVRDLNGVFQITSPLVDKNNDRLQIYVVPTETGDLKLTDDGYVIDELLMSGCDIFSSKKRTELLDFILKKFGVKRDGEALYLNATLKDFPQKKHFLLQAMLSVNDMFMTTREQVTSIFLEEVENFLYINDVRYLENISFIGQSGFTHNYDFVVPKYKSSPERVIKAINNPTKEKAEALLFSWEDTKETRKSQSVLYAFLNDSEKNINKNILGAFAYYDVKPVTWSNKDKVIKELSA
ncbi:hypothetical protein CHI02_23390 [Niallia circulans]|uniref:DUF1829 domain-containing protein n=1 Tax=Niallia circulans TaxID=1397 RepID=UPI000BA6DC40|nr:DUF1829 domain-containing protein [Niallia circulans]PAE09782.1 hypothetical protein CHI02_23390 [Niallia circulans]